MLPDRDLIDERFAAYVRDRGEHQLRVAVLLTGDWPTAEDLVQASLVKLYRAWPRLDTGADPDAYLRRIMLNTHRSWWRARWRRETPAAVLPERATGDDLADRHAAGALVRQALARLPRQQRAVLGGFPAILDQVDPQDLLALLKSATSVREVGPASGPGWTGTAAVRGTRLVTAGPGRRLSGGG
jgi:Sigma-70 region 2